MSDAPFFLQRLETRPDIPESGRFLLPICITRDELLSLVSALERFNRFTGIWSKDALWPVLQAIEYIGRPELAECYAGAYSGRDCLDYPPFASFVSYHPSDPFTDPELVPDGYEAPPFYINGRNGNDLPGYNPGDVIVPLDAFTLDNNWLTNLGENLPQIRVQTEGKGDLLLSLLNVPAGGMAIITVDAQPNLLDILEGLFGGEKIVDLFKDVISIPPESVEDIILDVPIDTDALHTTYITFLPQVDDSLIPLRFGGGLRRVTLCGGLRPAGQPEIEPPPLEGVEELRPEFQFTTDCGLEYRLKNQNGDIVQDWTTVPGWSENAALCFGGSGMTLTIEDICEAIVCGGNELARQLLRGVQQNLAPGGSIEIGNDGEVIVKAPGKTPDDPTTTADEEANSGGATGVRLGINTIWANLNAWFNGAVTINDARDRIKLIYDLFSEGADNLVDVYYAARVNSTPYPTSFASSLDSYIYCKGNYKTTIAEWIYEQHTANQQSVASYIVNALTQSQLDIWFNQGKLVPSTDYITYSCVPVDTEAFTLDAAYLPTNAYKQGTAVHKTNHLIELKVSGKVQHPSDGSYQDFFYHVASNGVRTFLGTSGTFGTIQFNAPFGNPTQAKVPFKPSGEYKVTMLVTTAAAAQFRRAISAGNMAAGSTGFTVTLKDLGEVVS